MSAVTANICSVVALGADDRSISVWQTKSARPVIVAKEVFERQILDLSWYVFRVEPDAFTDFIQQVPGWPNAIRCIFRWYHGRFEF